MYVRRRYMPNAYIRICILHNAHSKCVHTALHSAQLLHVFNTALNTIELMANEDKKYTAIFRAKF